MDTGHRIASGTIAKASLTTTYLLSALTKQSDQTVIEWVVNSTPPVKQRVRRAISGKDSRDGFYRFTWTFSIMSYGMYSYFISQFLSGVESAAVTVLTYDATNTAKYYQCTLHRPSEDSLDLVAIGARPVVFEFTHGVDIT